jgi:predicted nucleic acid-binding protein
VPRQWVVDASPLIVLGKIGQLPLLLRLTTSLVVPAGVAHELAAGPEADPARQWLAGPGRDWVHDIEEIDPLIATWDLGRGESHVLTWALRHPGCEAILDDLAARKCAAALSIPVRGTLGVLLLADLWPSPHHGPGSVAQERAYVVRPCRIARVPRPWRSRPDDPEGALKHASADPCRSGRRFSVGPGGP